MTASTSMLQRPLSHPHRSPSISCCQCAKLQASEPSIMHPTRMQASGNIAGHAVPGAARSGMQPLIMRNHRLRGERTPLTVPQDYQYGSGYNKSPQQAKVLSKAFTYEYGNSNNTKEVSARSASGYWGVYRRHSGKYQAQLRWQGLTRNLGDFEDAVLAAQAYDKTQLKLEQEYEGHQARSLNFPRAEYSPSAIAAQRLPWLEPRQLHSSSYMGVAWHVRLGKWQAYCCTLHRKMYFGSYKNQEDAAKARDKGVLRLFEQGYIFKLPDLNFPQSSYTEQDILSAYIPFLDRQYTSKFSHICLKRGKWVPQMGCYGYAWLGYYVNECDAAAVVDLALLQEIAQGRLKQVPKLNFSLTHYWKMLAEPDTFPSCEHLDMELIKDYLETLLWTALAHNEQA